MPDKLDPEALEIIRTSGCSIREAETRLAAADQSHLRLHNLLTKIHDLHQSAGSKWSPDHLATLHMHVKDLDQHLEDMRGIGEGGGGAPLRSPTSDAPVSHPAPSRHRRYAPK